MTKMHARNAKSGRWVNVKHGFINGVTDVLDVWGTPKTHHIPGVGRSTYEALKGDWVRLGGDMHRATDKVMLGGKK